MSLKECSPSAEKLPSAEFESLAQQIPVSWSWRTMESLNHRALTAAEGIVFDTVNESSGRRIATLLCVANPDQINRLEKVLGRASTAAPSRDWAQTNLFEMALQTALEGGFTYQEMRTTAGNRTAIALCAVGQKALRVVESLFKHAGTAEARWTEENPAANRVDAEAGEIIARLALPEDLRGRTINFGAFASDADCEFFHPGRTREEHEQIFAAVRFKLFSRGVEFTRSTLTPAMYAEAGRHTGDPANWAERRTFLVPIARGGMKP